MYGLRETANTLKVCVDDQVRYCALRCFSVDSEYKNLLVLQKYIHRVMYVVDHEKDLLTLCTQLTGATLFSTEWTQVYMETCMHLDMVEFSNREMSFNTVVAYLLKLQNSLILSYCDSRAIEPRINMF
jgi:hypothetical protein